MNNENVINFINSGFRNMTKGNLFLYIFVIVFFSFLTTLFSKNKILTGVIFGLITLSLSVFFIYNYNRMNPKKLRYLSDACFCSVWSILFFLLGYSVFLSSYSDIELWISIVFLLASILIFALLIIGMCFLIKRLVKRDKFNGTKPNESIAVFSALGAVSGISLMRLIARNTDGNQITMIMPFLSLFIAYIVGIVPCFNFFKLYYMKKLNYCWDDKEPLE